MQTQPFLSNKTSDVTCVCVCWFVCLCSVGVLHDQLSHHDRDDRPARQRKDLHVEEAHALPQLDRSPNQRWAPAARIESTRFTNMCGFD